MAKDVLHTGEVAKILGLPPRTVRELAKKRVLPTLERLGGEGYYRYPADQILKLKKQWSQSAAKFTKLQEVEKGEAKEFTKALNVSWLMSRFLSCLGTLDLCHISSIGTELTESLWVEREPLFPELKKLLNNKFWTKFDDWKKARVQYFKECVSFRDAVRQKVEQESRMKTTECWEEEGLHDTF